MTGVADRAFTIMAVDRSLQTSQVRILESYQSEHGLHTPFFKHMPEKKYDWRIIQDDIRPRQRGVFSNAIYTAVPATTPQVFRDILQNVLSEQVRQELNEGKNLTGRLYAVEVRR